MSSGHVHGHGHGFGRREATLAARRGDSRRRMWIALAGRIGHGLEEQFVVGRALRNFRPGMGCIEIGDGAANQQCERGSAARDNP